MSGWFELRTQGWSYQAIAGDRAMSGKVAAVHAAMRIIFARCRLLGLDSLSLIEEPAGPRTVVVPQDH